MKAQSQAKEHAGGPPPSAFIPIESWGESGFDVVPVFVWDPAACDTLSDILEEHRSHGKDPRKFLLQILAPEIREQMCSVLRKVLVYIRSTRKRALVVDQLFWISGASLAWDGGTLGKLASRHGISKQAFEQGANALRRQLFSIRSQTQRDEEARQKMSRRTTRRCKYE